ncbi:MAG: hypothetical protein QS748_14560 [Candidatus Endonucleobacter bathymodioli]|uniref:Uncharacterized protein n=1 Tax=Candidatus Endonucleibacter bathymodioli TaxID=539814 RepID=A0AA90P3C9_9GAMM|nr:hypothetical protein [Candidatus Endonucleobacter bathymodioli]
MILKLLYIPKLYTYRLNILALAKGILFSYCLLTSMYIKSVLDNNNPKRIDQEKEKEKEKWVFMIIPQSLVLAHTKYTYYIAMIDKEIASNESLKHDTDNILLAMLPDNNIEGVPSVNNYTSPPLNSMDNI